MSRITTYLVLGLALFAVLGTSAQTYTSSEIIEAIVESHLDKLDEQTDVALIIEDLEDLADNPLNINNTNAYQLSRLYLLNGIQIERLLNYIKNYGPAYSVYELNTIEGFSAALLQKMEPFVFFGPAEDIALSFSDRMKSARHQLLGRVLGTAQTPRGYKSKPDGSIPFEGNRFRYYSRYRFEIRDFVSAGITTEKDPGEAFFKGSNKHGFDYYSGHLSFNTGKRIQNITLGDYLIRAGQGLVLWQGYTSGKSENVMGIAKNGQGLRPYTSVNENLYFRGMATVIQAFNGQLILFGSYNKSDANRAFSDSTGQYFTSLQTSGYHRTQSEIEDEKSIRNTNAGWVFSRKFKNLKIGTTLLYQEFNMPYVPQERLYNLHRFNGKSNVTGSVDYLLVKNNYQFFGEFALSKSKGKAFTQGLLANLTDQISFSALFRHFDKNYHALWANTFAEGTLVNNESGMYLGTKILPVKYVTLTAYADVYRSAWLNYSTAAPARSWDIFTQADFRFSEGFAIYIRFKNEEKEQKFKQEKRYINLPERTQKSRLHFQFKPSENLTFKTRIEHVFYTGTESENGFLVFQDIQYSLVQVPLNFSVRLAYFNTESYNSRIYAYENDLLYTFSIPAYYGKGFRSYINLKYQISKRLEGWIKVANTHRTDSETISSGYNEIAGNNKTELKFQLRLKF